MAATCLGNGGWDDPADVLEDELDAAGERLGGRAIAGVLDVSDSRAAGGEC